MLEKSRLEVASLKQKLEAKNTELRDIQGDKESLEAKLDEEREDARRMAEELKERLATSQKSLEGKLEVQAAELRYAKRISCRTRVGKVALWQRNCFGQCCSSRVQGMPSR